MSPAPRQPSALKDGVTHLNGHMPYVPRFSTSCPPVSASYSAPSISIFIKSHRFNSMEANKSPGVKLWTSSLGRGYFVDLNSELAPLFMAVVRARLTL